MINWLALSLVSVVLVGAVPKPVLIPLEYQGSWSMDPAYCNFEGDTLDNELYVTASTVEFHAEGHRVKSIKLRKGKVSLRYKKMADATRVPPSVLVLSRDKAMLNALWHRCPDVPQVQVSQ